MVSAVVVSGHNNWDYHSLAFWVNETAYRLTYTELQELCVPVTASTSRRHLRSAARGELQVLACRTSTFGP